MEKTGEKRELGIILALKLDIYPSISLSPKHTIKVFIVVAILVLEHVLILSTSEVGFTISRGSGSYNPQGVSNGGHGASSLKSQLSFTRQDSLSEISQSENIVDGINSDNGHHRPTHSYTTTSFGMDNWDNSNSIVFSAPLSKCSKANIDGDIFNCLSALESQFSLPQTSLEMATMEKLLHIPEDSVACKIRAKRGCATHPRSIAEQERRTRISEKLKKLQDLVPNVDKSENIIGQKCNGGWGTKSSSTSCILASSKKERNSKEILKIARVDARKAHEVFLLIRYCDRTVCKEANHIDGKKS